MLAGFERLGGVEIEAGLGLVDVGANAGAGGKGFSGGFELAGVGLDLGLDEGDLVVGEEQIKIGLGKAGGQLLAGVGEVGFASTTWAPAWRSTAHWTGCRRGWPDGDGLGAAVVILAGIDRAPEDGGVRFEFVEVAADAEADLAMS